MAQLVILMILLFFSTGGCQARWAEKFDDNYWEIADDIGYGSWDAVNSEWDSELVPTVQYITLKDIGTWATNFRPSKIRVTFTGVAGIAIVLMDEDENIIATKGTFGSYIY